MKVLFVGMLQTSLVICSGIKKEIFLLWRLLQVLLTCVHMFNRYFSILFSLSSKYRKGKGIQRNRKLVISMVFLSAFWVTNWILSSVYKLASTSSKVWRWAALCWYWRGVARCLNLPLSLLFFICLPWSIFDSIIEWRSAVQFEKK